MAAIDIFKFCSGCDIDLMNKDKHVSIAVYKKKYIQYAFIYSTYHIYMYICMNIYKFEIRLTNNSRC
jgi:hypothetical protein